MNCLEIKIGDKVYQLKNVNNTQSEYFDGSDWDVIYRFLTSGQLPNGWESEDGNPEEVFNKVLVGIKTNETKTTIDGTEDHIINNLVGNASFRELDEDSIFPDKNVLVLKSLSVGSYYYGVNKNRIILITDDSNWYLGDYSRIVYDTYKLVKEGNKSAISAINSLYKTVSNDNESDVYKQMSYLANNHKDEFGKAFYNPYNTVVKDVTKRAIESNFSNYKNCYIKLRSSKDTEKYFVLKSLDKTTSDIKGTLIAIENNKSTKSETTLKLEDILKHKLFYPVSFNSNIMLNKRWFNKNYSLLNPDKANKNFRDYLSISSNTFSIDLSGLNISGEEILDFKNENKLVGEVQVLTNEGIYIKSADSNDFVINVDGDIRKLKKDVKIKRISFDPRENPEFDLYIVEKSDISKKLSNPMLRLLLATDYPGVVVFNNFSNKSSINVHTSNRIDKNYEVVVKFGNTPIYYNEEFFLELEAATKFVNDINENPSIIDTFDGTVNQEWRNIRKALKDIEGNEQYQDYVSYAISKAASFDPNRIDVLNEENIESFNDSQMTEFTEKLKSLGLYSHICKI